MRSADQLPTTVGNWAESCWTTACGIVRAPPLEKQEAWILAWGLSLGILLLLLMRYWLWTEQVPVVRESPCRERRCWQLEVQQLALTWQRLRGTGGTGSPSWDCSLSPGLPLLPPWEAPTTPRTAQPRPRPCPVRPCFPSHELWRWEVTPPFWQLSQLPVAEAIPGDKACAQTLRHSVASS